MIPFKGQIRDTTGASGAGLTKEADAYLKALDVQTITHEEFTAAKAKVDDSKAYWREHATGKHHNCLPADKRDGDPASNFERSIVEGYEFADSVRSGSIEDTDRKYFAYWHERDPNTEARNTLVTWMGTKLFVVLDWRFSTRMVFGRVMRTRVGRAATFDGTIVSFSGPRDTGDYVKVRVVKSAKKLPSNVIEGLWKNVEINTKANTCLVCGENVITFGPECPKGDGVHVMPKK